MFKTSSLLLALLIGAAGSAAYAGETYVGGNLGVRSQYNFDCVSGAPCDRTGELSGKIFGGILSDVGQGSGVKFSQGVELMAYNIGDAKLGIETASGRVAGTAKTYGVGASYVFQADFSDLALVGRLGTAYARGKVDYAAGGSAGKTAFFVPLVGVGARFALTKEWSLNADWDRLPVKLNETMKNGAINMFSLGASYKF